MGRHNKVRQFFFPPHPVPIFNHSSYLHVRERDYLGAQVCLLVFRVDLIEYFSVEVDRRAVRLNGTRADLLYVQSCGIRDFEICVFAALFLGRAAIASLQSSKPRATSQSTDSCTASSEL